MTDLVSRNENIFHPTLCKISLRHLGASPGTCPFSSLRPFAYTVLSARFLLHMYPHPVHFCSPVRHRLLKCNFLQTTLCNSSSFLAPAFFQGSGSCHRSNPSVRLCLKSFSLRNWLGTPEITDLSS